MRKTAVVLVLLGLAGCGSQAKPLALPSPTPSASPEPSETPEPTPSAEVPISTPSPGATAAPSTAVVVPSATASPVPLMSPGQRYTVTAQVVRLSGKPDQLCAPAAEQATTGDPKPCAFGIVTQGIDFAKLQDRVQKDKAVRGRATLTVTLDKGVLHVTEQSVPPALVADPGFRNPPCTAPKGGWPKGKDDESLDQTAVADYRRRNPNAIVAVAQLRPSKNQVVEYVLTNGDPQQVDKDLRPSYGARFCAVKSTWTRKQADDADLDRAFRYGDDRGVYLRDSSALSASGQLEVHVGAVLETPALAAAVKKAPAGLVRLELLLTPVTG